MTFSQLHFFLQGRKDDRLEGWRQARWMVSYITAPHVKTPLKPHKILPLDGDIVLKEQLSAEEYNELKSKWYNNTAKA